MLEILTDICEGNGKEGDIELLEELATMIKRFSLCGLGKFSGGVRGTHQGQEMPGRRL